MRLLLPLLIGGAHVHAVPAADEVDAVLAVDATGAAPLPEEPALATAAVVPFPQQAHRPAPLRASDPARFPRLEPGAPTVLEPWRYGGAVILELAPGVDDVRDALTPRATRRAPRRRGPATPPAPPTRSSSRPP